MSRFKFSLPAFINSIVLAAFFVFGVGFIGTNIFMGGFMSGRAVNFMLSEPQSPKLFDPDRFDSIRGLLYSPHIGPTTAYWLSAVANLAVVIACSIAVGLLLFVVQILLCRMLYGKPKLTRGYFGWSMLANSWLAASLSMYSYIEMSGFGPAGIYGIFNNVPGIALAPFVFLTVTMIAQHRLNTKACSTPKTIAIQEVGC